jgi:hypothetical protein
MQRPLMYLIALVLAVTGAGFAGLTAPSAAAAPAPSTVHAAKKDANCSDFANQAAAQNYFINHGGPNSDPDGLDSDGDGIACESNPCPCSNNTGGGGGGGGGGPAPHPKPAHKLSARGQEIRNTGKFIALGRVFTLPNGRIAILRKAGSSAYKPYKFAHTAKVTGKFRTSITQVGSKKTCFRVVAPETKKYRKTIKDIGCITSR